MYNRYIPQSDGSYRKNSVPEPSPPPEEVPGRPAHTQEDFPASPSFGAGQFLRNLIPRNLDTGDLMVIILLLLMAGDSAEGKNNALLTLALYLFL